METERIALSQRERDRLRVLHEVKQKQITQVEAAKRLKISDRHIRRLLLRLGEHGDRAVIHGLRGRRSNRRLAARLELKILSRVRQRYADFGPTLAAEHLAPEGLPVSRETLLTIWEVRAILTSCVLPPRLFSPSRSCWPHCWPPSLMSMRRNMKLTRRGTGPLSSTAPYPLMRPATPRTLPLARMTMTLRVRHSWTFSTSQRPCRFPSRTFQR